MWARERRNLDLLLFPQSGAIRKEARKYWGFSTLDFRGERLAKGLNGGSEGTSSQLSSILSHLSY